MGFPDVHNIAFGGEVEVFFFSFIGNQHCTGILCIQWSSLSVFEILKEVVPIHVYFPISTAGGDTGKINTRITVTNAGIMYIRAHSSDEWMCWSPKPIIKGSMRQWATSLWVREWDTYRATTAKAIRKAKTALTSFWLFCTLPTRKKAKERSTAASDSKTRRTKDIDGNEYDGVNTS